MNGGFIILMEIGRMKFYEITFRGCDRKISGLVNGCRQHKAIVIIRVFANEVDPAG